MDQDLLGIMRAMAWQRAVGELRSILQAFQSDGKHDMHERFRAFNELTEVYIKEVERRGLAE